MKRVAAILSLSTFLVKAMASAHDVNMDHATHTADSHMAKLHEMMPMYAEARGKINEALVKGNAAAVKTETAKIMATIPDLKISKPHKNLKQLPEFRKIATAFAADVRKTAVLAGGGDLTGAGEAFKVAQKRCDECHARFRD